MKTKKSRKYLKLSNIKKRSSFFLLETISKTIQKLTSNVREAKTIACKHNWLMKRKGKQKQKQKGKQKQKHFGSQFMLPDEKNVYVLCRK